MNDIKFITNYYPGRFGCPNDPAPEAVGQGSLAKLQAHIDSGGCAESPTPGGATLLQWAAARQNPAMVRLLIAAGAKIDATHESGMTALHWAMYKAEDEAVAAEILEILLQANADPNAQTAEHKHTALHFAVHRDAIQAAELLLEAGAEPDLCGADPHMPMERDAPPLHLVRSVAMAELLFKRRKRWFSVNVADSWGRTALHRHTMTPDVAEYLIRRGADVNARMDGRATPIFRAPDRMLPVLLNYGADVNIAGDSGEKLDRARRREGRSEQAIKEYMQAEKHIYVECEDEGSAGSTLLGHENPKKSLTVPQHIWQKVFPDAGSEPDGLLKRCRLLKPGDDAFGRMFELCDLAGLGRHFEGKMRRRMA